VGPASGDGAGRMPASLAGMKAAAALALLVVLGGAGCGGTGDAAAPPRDAEGYVVAVAGEGSDVPSFTLQVGTEEYEVLIDPAIDYGFDLAHLRDHQRSSEPVRCVLEQREGGTYALRIEDVEAAPS
jgi:hypothetical protein